MTREEHILWAKGRALDLLDHGDLGGAVASMMNDLRQHEATSGLTDSAIALTGLPAAASGDPEKVRRWIEAFR